MFGLGWVETSQVFQRFPIRAVLLPSCAPDQVQYVTCKRLSSADLEARAKAWQVGLKTGGPSASGGLE